jgi:electron transfer flavoprotein alpha subunit
MERVLFLTPVDPKGELSKPVLEALHAGVDLAKALDAPLWIGFFGSGAKSAAERAAAIGAAEILTVSGAGFDTPRYASDVAAMDALVVATAATVVLAPATSRVSRAMPAVAVRRGGRIDTHVTSLEAKEGALTAERWFYRQRMLAAFSRSHRPWFLTLEPGISTPWRGESGPVTPKEVPVAEPAGGWRTRGMGEQAASAGAQTIRPDAEFLFVAGAGWMKKQTDGKSHVREAEDLIRNFLEISQASLGSSKSLVDQSGEGGDVISFLTHLNQVGQTGSTPRHKKGLATCCHGEEPHVVGWRFIQERRAVNLDPNCGWARGKADLVYVADAFQVVAKLNEILAGGDSPR